MNILHLNESLAISRSSSERRITRAHFSLALCFITFLIKAAAQKRKCVNLVFLKRRRGILYVCLFRFPQKSDLPTRHDLITSVTENCVVFYRKYRRRGQFASSAESPLLNCDIHNTKLTTSHLKIQKTNKTHE